MAQPMLEVVACSVADAVAAQRCGVDRIELCSVIELGGVTPSIGLCKEVLAAVDIPVVALIRPRAGDFTYGDTELETMEQDAEALIEAGVQGIVFGVLDGADRVAVEPNRRLLRIAPGRETVFHRAFDVTPDPLEALDTLIELGFTRVLTSGQRATATEGAALIRELVERSAGRIQVMAGGGIRGDLEQVLLATGVCQIHMGPLKRLGQRVGLYSEGYSALDEDVLRLAVEQFRARWDQGPRQ